MERPKKPALGRPSPVRLVWLALLGVQPGLARASDAPDPSPSSPEAPVVEVREHRLYLAPGVQFGSSSQEITLGIGRVAVTRREPILGDIRSISGGWVGGGLRLSGVALSWKPVAVHALAYVTAGGWGWEWWPVGFEFAVGGGGNASRGYGLLQISYLAGVGSRFEAFATVQLPVGEGVASPEWLSRWLFGLRFGFDLVAPRRERFTRVEEVEQGPGARD